MDFYKCSKCGELKPATEYSRDRTKKSGHKSQCKTCDKNRPGRSEYAKQYREAHRDYFREKHAEYRERNREKIRIESRKYYDPQKAKAYYDANRDHKRAYARDYNKTEKARTGKREYRRTRRAVIACGDKKINLQAVFDCAGGRCRICGRMCDFDDYVIRDGDKIVGDNYPSIDHIKPLSKGGLHTWENVQLAHKKCNSEKSDKF